MKGHGVLREQGSVVGLNQRCRVEGDGAGTAGVTVDPVLWLPFFL
jgi:hypothetical protein